MIDPREVERLKREYEKESAAYQEAKASLKAAQEGHAAAQNRACKAHQTLVDYIRKEVGLDFLPIY